MVKDGEEVALVQSGNQPIWRSQSTHNIQVRKIWCGTHIVFRLMRTSFILANRKVLLQ